MTPTAADADKCRTLWGRVFELAMLDAQAHIPRYPPTEYDRKKYLRGRRRQNGSISPPKEWVRRRRLEANRLRRRADEALAWIEGEAFDICCQLANVDTAAMRERLMREIEGKVAA